MPARRTKQHEGCEEDGCNAGGLPYWRSATGIVLMAVAEHMRLSGDEGSEFPPEFIDKRAAEARADERQRIFELLSDAECRRIAGLLDGGTPS